MEQGLKEYFAKLCENFWQPGNNLKIKHELGYELEPDIGDMSWFFRIFNNPTKPQADELVFSVNFYKFYNQLIDDEPSLIKFLGLLPISYHKIIMNKCSDSYDALTLIVKTIENDWSKNELINYFELKIN